MSCAGSQSGQKAGYSPSTEPGVANGDSGWVYPPLQVETVVPLKPRVPGFYVAPIPVAGAPDTLKRLVPATVETLVVQVENDSIEGPPAPPPPFLGKMKAMSGFRVQLVASPDPVVARQVEGRAKELYGDIVYLVFDAPQYKVRAGNFTNKNDANKFKVRSQNDGFKGSWIVPSQVLVPE